jgi:hypothetical protein
MTIVSRAVPVAFVAVKPEPLSQRVQLFVQPPFPTRPEPTAYFIGPP